MFDQKVQEANVVQIKHFLCHWKVFKTKIFKMICILDLKLLPKCYNQEKGKRLRVLKRD
jgi:hypothetical protein